MCAKNTFRSPQPKGRPHAILCNDWTGRDKKEHVILICSFPLFLLQLPWHEYFCSEVFTSILYCAFGRFDQIWFGQSIQKRRYTKIGGNPVSLWHPVWFCVNPAGDTTDSLGGLSVDRLKHGLLIWKESGQSTTVISSLNDSLEWVNGTLVNAYEPTFRWAETDQSD